MFSCRLDYSVRGDLRTSQVSGMQTRMVMLLGHVTKESRQSLGPGTIFFPTEDLRKNMNQNTKKSDKEMLQSHEALLQEGSGASPGWTQH